MAKIKRIVVHCSDSEWGNAEVISRWHKQRGWRMIGYHFVILNGHEKYKSDYDESKDGSIETGRLLDNDLFLKGQEIGAHAYGFNNSSIGICLIGKKDFTEAQMKNLKDIIVSMIDTYELSVEDVVGHYEVNKHKACPNIDMKEFRKELKEYIDSSICSE
jgi:N-acetylmuramoyl-L-alanine amidase